MTSEETGALWRLEELFWTGGLDAYGAAMHPDCTMAFEIGLLRGAQILAALADAPRWDALEIKAPQIAHPAPDLAILSYEARATRGESVRRAACTSTYLRGPRGWALVQHQQTPLADAP